MKLWIESNILTDTNDKLLTKGAIHVLSLFKQDGFEIGTDPQSLSKSQKRILDNEELISFEEKEENTAQINYDKSEGKLFLWIGDDPVASGYDLNELYQSYETGSDRKASIQRTTNETDISINLNLDGTGKADIKTGLNFFDHMLDQIAKHGFVDLQLNCDGDLEVDEHHTIEDVAIALGEAITKALGDKKGIERYAFVLPMDEAQATVALDLSGRPYLVFEGEFNREYVGDLPTEMVKHFFYSLAMNLKATLQIEFKGENDHHKIEAIFKGFARVLKTAVEKNPRIKNQIPSSKGAL